MNAPPINATIVVCTRNRPVELERCLASLARLEPTPREVIVVNSAGGPTAEPIALRHSAIYVETCEPGVSHARNVGAAAATSELVAFVDDDAVTTTNWLSAMVAPFADPEVAAVFARVEPMEPLNQIGQRYFDQAFRGARIASLDRSNPDWFWLANTGHISMGTAMMLRRQLFERWSGFDPRLGRGSIIPGAEEHCACSQIIELGYRCVYAREAVVQHPALASIQQLRGFEGQMMEIASAYLTLLYLENPSRRREIRRQFIGRIIHGSSQRIEHNAPSRTISRLRQAFAVLRGLHLSWRARSARRFGRR